jgi:hypothetical protein
MRPIIHVGFAKTGTTWLQKNIFRGHPDIVWVLPARFVHDELIGPDAFSFDPDKARRSLEARTAAGEGGAVLGISYERLAGNPYYDGVCDGGIIAERIKAAFPDGKIIIGVRNQVPMIESMYKEYIASGGTCRLRAYLDPPFDASRLPPRLCLDFLKYDRLIERYQSLFGRDRVHVHAYEDFARDKRAFLEALYAFMEIAPYWPEDLYDVPRQNTVSSRATLTLFRLTNHLFRGGFRPSGILPGKNPLRRRVERWDRHVRKVFRRRFSVPVRVRDRLENEYRASNRRLCEITGLDVVSRGYPT